MSYRVPPRSSQYRYAKRRRRPTSMKGWAAWAIGLPIAFVVAVFTMVVALVSVVLAIVGALLVPALAITVILLGLDMLNVINVVPWF